MYKHILIPTDGTPRSRAATAAALRLARKLGARVTGLYAAPPPTPVRFQGLLPVGYLPPAEHAALIDRAAERYLGAIANAARAAGVRCTTVRVTSDYPAEAILDTARARRCDAIFMASHGHHGAAAVLLGSETQKVLTGARIPVIVHRKIAGHPRRRTRSGA